MSGDLDALIAALGEATGDLVAQPSSEQVRPVLTQAIQTIARHRPYIEEPGQAALADATMSLLAASAASMGAIGVCRVEEPFADVYEVIDSDGSGGYVRRLCCTHTKQQHCVTG